MGTSRSNAKPPRAHAGKRSASKGPDEPPHNADHVLSAIYADIHAIKQDLRAALDANGEWLPLKQAVRRLGVGIETLRAVLKEADRAGETTVLEGIRFRRVGRGKQKPRYVIWAPDLATERQA